MSQEFSVTGLSCQSCVKHVTTALTALPGVDSVRVDLGSDAPSKVYVDASRPLGMMKYRPPSRKKATTRWSGEDLPAGQCGRRGDREQGDASSCRRSVRVRTMRRGPGVREGLSLL